jgi:predicted nucleic acid-binding protein
MARLGYVEVLRTLLTAGLEREAASFRGEWEQFNVVELDHELAIRAAELASGQRLRSLDAIHLASALAIPEAGRVIATWDRRLHTAARQLGLDVLPAEL